MSSATRLPCCSSRTATRCLRTLLTTLSLVVAWPPPAVTSLSATEPELCFLGPANREQPRQTDEARADEARAYRAKLWQQSILRIVQRSTETVVQHTGDLHNDLPTPSEALARPTTTDQPKSASCYVAAPMSSLTVDISYPAGSLPNDVAAQCAATTNPVGDRRLWGGWCDTQHHWSATCLRHRPLYFEEVNAERYGYTPAYCLQPFVSAGRFFATIAALPYKMVVDPPRDCIYVLGHYRPGSCVPRRRHHLPLHTRAALVQTGVIAGLILLIP